ncbi:MAG TPA: hypothetical protein PK513_01600 [Alphaproteobacteria bacterium]|nr:hypothetical protein [Alphaproteobacteria bacterium]USO05977.1 MAG: hypothetical protein H6859_01870 [Rhodospirillales bacterium]HOO81178.1 hypothetical protein [Alphaproteobacteria bacterium]
MNNKKNTKIRRQAKQATMRGNYENAISLIDNGIKEQDRTFDDLLTLQECLGLSGAWLQAECIRDILFDRINTVKQGKRFAALQERLDPPKLSNITRGRQFGGAWHTRNNLDPSQG